MVFFRSCLVVTDAETENKTCQISSQGSSYRLLEIFWNTQYLTETQNIWLQLLRLREVVAIRDSTVISMRRGLFTLENDMTIAYYYRESRSWSRISTNVDTSRSNIRYRLQHLQEKQVFKSKSMTQPLPITMHKKECFTNELTWLFPRPGSPTTRMCGFPLTGMRFCGTEETADKT